jgi:hypothetical protein
MTHSALVLIALCALAAPVTAQTEAPRTARRSVLAVRADQPVRVDGNFDDPVWQAAPAAAEFTQSEPREGQPATERTEVRIAYDDDNLYVAAYLYDREPDGIVVNDIRKDFTADDQDTFEIILDTFLDRRNGYVFLTNAQGAKSDQQSANEGREINTSWDAVWSVSTRHMPDGWTAEFAIPFRSLRFDDASRDRAVAGDDGGNGQGVLEQDGMVWGVNFSRRIRRRNEVAYWAPVPRSYNLNRVSLAGDLRGLPQAAGGRDLRIKPYVAGRAIRETGGSGFAETGDVGLDAKYGLGESLTLDLTANPDFAQVEVDEQQVNLTQFNQFFPEKREFFLENSGVFYVGDAARNNRVFRAPTPDEDLLLFFSRRVGLTSTGREIPILGGARVTGRAGGLVIGALTAQTRAAHDAPANNYSVLRLRKNVFSSSDVGLIAMSRQSMDESADFNRVFGADVNLRLPGETDWSSYAIRTVAPGIDDGEYAVRTSISHEGNFFHGKAGFMAIGDGFQNEMGYYRRTGIHKWLTDIGIRPRPEVLRRIGIREMHPHIVWDYYTDLSGVMVGKRFHSGYTFFFDNGAFTELSYNPRFEKLEDELRLHPDAAALPAGDYGWNEWMLRVNTDPSRVLSASIAGTVGGLWSGTQRTLNATINIKPSYRFRAAIGAQRTDARLAAPVGDFVRTIWTTRANYSFSTNMFIDAFAQYDPDRDQFNTNVRFNLIHRPLSDLFIVYNEQRITGTDAPVAGRSVILKFTRMFSF